MAILGRLMAALQGRQLATDAEQDFLDQAADMGEERLRRYQLYEDYYTGEYAVPLRERTKHFLEDQSQLGFNENFCDTIVDVLAERLHITGFASSAAEETEPAEAGGDAEAAETSDPFAEQLDEWWQRCRWDTLEQVAHTQTVMKGDGALIVDFDPDRGLPVISFNDPRLVKFVYSEDNPDELAYVPKTWTTKTAGPSNPDGRPVRRLNIYWPDRVEKWFRLHSGTKGGWARWLDQGDETWPTPWTVDGTPAGEPLGIPVFHLHHRALGSRLGRSRLRPVISFQNELNKNVVDLNELTDNYAFPQRHVSGVSGEVDLKSTPGNVWKATGENSKWGQFDIAETTQLLNAIEGILSRLARRSRTPMHLLTGGTPPSGESLKTSESGLVSTATALMTELGAAWEQAMVMALKLAAVNDAGPELPDDFTVDVQWANPETRSDQADVTVAEGKQRLGVSKHTLLREMGYDPEREAVLRQQEQEASAEIAARMFDAGAIGE